VILFRYLRRLTQLLSRQNFLVTGTLLLSISPFLCALLYWGAALRTPWGNWRQVFNHDKLVLAGIIFIISTGLYCRNIQTENFQPGAIALSDYVPFFIIFYLLSLKPFTTSEIYAFLYTILLNAPQQLILGISERYWGQYGRITFPNQQIPILDLFIGPAQSGLSTSAGFFNPNILSCFCVLVMGIAFSILNARVQLVRSQSLTRALIWSELLLSAISITSAGLLLIWSKSDNGFLGFLCLLFFLGSITWVRSSKNIILTTFAMAMTSMILITSLQLSHFYTYLVPPSFISIGTKVLMSFEDRLSIYDCAFQLVQQEPLFGWGIGRFATECTQRTGFPLIHSHNILLQLAAEAGLPLMVLVFGFVGYIFVRSFGGSQGQYTSLEQVEKRPDKIILLSILSVLLAVIIMHLFDLPLLASYRINYLFWACLAIPFSCLSIHNKNSSRIKF
jgi:O-antigen ligase